MNIATLLPDCKINNLLCDSRQVQPGDVFLAYPGLTVDGRDFISQAIAQGAAAVLFESRDVKQLPKTDIPLIPVEQLADHVGVLASEFLGNPTHQMTMIGVTGTNGKTSVTQFLAQGIENCAVIGTTGTGFLPNLQKSTHTTPDAIQLQYDCHALLNEGAKAIAMEVSSHALDQGRINGVDFNVGVFTNLSRDHLDYHGDMQAYAAAKRRLFEDFSLQHAVINGDDIVGQAYLKQLSPNQSVIATSTHRANAAYPAVIAESIQLTGHGFRVVVNTPWGKDEFETTLIGRFNIHNVLSFIAVMGVLGYPLSDSCHKAAGLKPAPGRMQLFTVQGRPTVVVDYAHTPDALEKALTALREHCQGQIWCVFGCGGDRDPGKRAMMGQIAAARADQVIITNDNPRSEDPQCIADAICEGIDQRNYVQIILDRRSAIQQAIAQAREGDVVLIAGKGHENYQLIGDKTLPFADGEVVREQLQ